MNEFGKYGEHYGEFITVYDGKIYVSDLEL